jgi:D-glycero-alpha-D-manno-heptose-7-phosphate kinase
MIVCRTPYRISFFGGGTDYAAWYREHGGAVLATTINKYCYLTCRYLPPFFDHRFRVVYSKIENAQRVEDIRHGAVRETLKFLGVDRGLEIHHDGDLPARSGMGSSSSFTVGLLHAVHALHGRLPSRHQLATEAIEIERERLKETVGSQDQVSAAYGGLNHVTFLPDGEFSVRPMTLPHQRVSELESHLLLFYTGIARTASQVAASFVPHLHDRRRELRILKDMVDESVAILTGRQDIESFGTLLHEAWEAKRNLGPQVSSSDIDDIYARARAAGASGGKLIGAGGGGFLLLFAPPDRHQRLREALAPLLHVPFTFEFSGSQVIFVDRQEDFAAEDKRRPLRARSKVHTFVAPHTAAS